MLCPVCKKQPLTGRRETCSERCRQRRSRAVRGSRVARARQILTQQSAALANGADPMLIAQLSRDARRLLGD